MSSFMHLFLYSKILFEGLIARQCAKHWGIMMGKTSFFPSRSLQDSWRETEKYIGSYNELSAVLEVISMYCGRNSFIHLINIYVPSS